MPRTKPLPRKQRVLNRGYLYSRSGENIKNPEVTLIDIDSSILFYFENVIKPSVEESGENVKVPIMYSNPERWSIVQKRGYLLDNKKIGELESKNRVGIVTGLAWTEYGGEILKIETVTMPGKGRMQITGKLGDVMQESVKAAKSFVRSKCLEYGIIPPIFEKKDFHIHVPEGATPKDGPSAGVSMFTSIVSLMTGKPVKDKVAMTGEITLRGNVLPIGGVKEKVTAAHRSGIKHIILPDHNKKDLEDIPDHIKKDLNLNEDQKEIAEEIIWNTNERGYLDTDIILIADRFDLLENEIEPILYKVQRLEPRGIASRNLQECLSIQLENEENSLSHKIIHHYFDDFMHKRYERIIE